jgi:hypothetical protein
MTRIRPHAAEGLRTLSFKNLYDSVKPLSFIFLFLFVEFLLVYTGNSDSALLFTISFFVTRYHQYYFSYVTLPAFVLAWIQAQTTYALLSQASTKSYQLWYVLATFVNTTLNIYVYSLHWLKYCKDLFESIANSHDRVRFSVGAIPILLLVCSDLFNPINLCRNLLFIFPIAGLYCQSFGYHSLYLVIWNYFDPPKKVSPVKIETFRAKLVTVPQMNFVKPNRNRETKRGFNSSLNRTPVSTSALCHRRLKEGLKIKAQNIKTARERKRTNPQINLIPEVPLKHGLDEPTIQLIYELSNSISAGIDINHKLDPSVTKILETLDNSFTSSGLPIEAPDIKCDTGDLTHLAIIACTVHYHVSQRSDTSFAVMVMSIGYALIGSNLVSQFLHFAVLKNFVSYIRSYVNPATKPEFNSSTLTSLSKSVVLLLSGYLALDKVKLVDGKNAAHFLFNSFNDFDKKSKSLESSSSFVINLLNDTVNYIKVNLLNRGADRWITSENSAVADFQSKFDAVCNEMNLGTFLYVPASTVRIHGLWQEGLKLLGSVPRDQSTSGTISLLNVCNNYLLALKKKLEAMHLGSDTTHQEPYCVNFIGPPGGGKTMALQKLGRAVAPYLDMDASMREAWEKDPSSIEYPRSPDSEFWDGLRTQLIYYFDEFGQATDVAGNPINQYFEFIRIKNIFSSIANMASLEEKGNVRIAPMLMILSTNRTNFAKLESIISPDAVTRRFDRSYLVVPMNKYCTYESMDGNIWDRRFDEGKMPQGKYTTCMNEEMLEYHEYDWKAHPDNRLTGKVFTFDQVIEHTVQGIDRNKKRYLQFSEELESLRTHHIERAKEAVQHDEFLFEEEIENNPHKVQIKNFITAKFSELVGGVTTYALARYYYCQAYGVKFAEIAKGSLEDVVDFYHDVSFNFPPQLELNMAFIKKPQIGSLVPRLPFSLSEKFDSMRKNIRHIWQDSKCWIIIVWERIKMELNEAFSVLIKYMVIFSMLSLASMIVSKIALWVARFFGTRTNKKKKTSSELEQESGNARKSKNKGNSKQKSSKNITDADMSKVFSEGNFKKDPAAVAIADKIVRRNTYTMYLNGERSGTITFLCDRIALMPRHFLTYMYCAYQDDKSYGEEIVVLKKSLSTIEIKVKVRDFFNFHSTNSLETHDAVLVKLNPAPHHASILKYFATFEEFKTYNQVCVRLVTPYTDNVTTQLSVATRIEDHEVNGESGENDTIPNYVISNAYEYDAETKTGYCGSLLFLQEPTVPSHKILGIHVAGSSVTAYGISCALTQEMLSECLKKFEYVYHEFESSVPQFSGEFHKGKFTPLYEIEKPVFSPTVTKIEKSILHGTWTPALKSPGILVPHYHEGQYINPIEAALDKYSKPPIVINHELFELLACQLLDDLKSQSPIRFESKIFTIEEAILGIPGTSFGAISRSTSPGYPYIVDPRRKSTGKKDWLGSEQDYDLSSDLMQEVIENVKEYETKAKLGIRVPILYVDCLKDELRKFSKIHVPRLFQVSPFHYLILWRMYFGASTMWLFDNKVANGFVVGVNPYCNDWDNLAKKLLQFGSSDFANIGAGDYSAFDASEKSVIHQHILSIFNDMYEDSSENQMVRTVLFLELINSQHIVGNLVYEWIDSLPSGHPFTTVINNFYNALAFRYCWYRVNDNSLLSITNFHKYIYLAVQGDDNVFSVHPDYKSRFTESTIVPYMAELGLTYTSDIKDTANIALRKLSEVTFLQRSFRYEPFFDAFVAPLNLNVTLQIPFWTKRGVHSIEITQDNLITSIRELSLHPKEIFEEWAPRIIQSAEKFNFKFPVTNRSLLLALVRDLELFY